MNDHIYSDLKKLEDWLNSKGYTGESAACRAAIGEIQRLRSDNEILKTSLKPFLAMMDLPKPFSYLEAK